MDRADKKQTILIVDDEPISVGMLASVLQDEYRVIMAHDGREALDLAFNDAPDLILLDIIMPDIDGYQVFRLIRKNENLANVPVLFITAMGVEECESQGLEMGAGDYIVKPFNPSLVRLRVRNHLEIKRQRDLLKAKSDELQRLNETLACEIEQRRAIQLSNENLIHELQEAIAHVKTLTGLLPICASCKKVRDDQGYWDQLETYLCKHSDITFSHGLCLECAEKLYPQYSKNKRD